MERLRSLTGRVLESADETNERAGVPYATLSPAERLTLLADLAALP